MKVYVLVKVYDEGDFGSKPGINTRSFSSLDEAKKALKQEKEQFEECNDVDSNSVISTDTYFYCYTNEQHQYGMSPQLTLEIKENVLW